MTGRVRPSIDRPRSSAIPDWLDHALGEAVIHCDHAGRVIDAFGATDALPVDRAALRGQRIADIEALPATLRQAWTTGFERTVDTQRAQLCAYELDRDQQVRAFEARMMPIPSGHVVVVIREVTERNRLRERVEHVAMHDLLTGLANARALRERLASWMRPSRTGRADETAPVVLLIVDLDRLKQTNDLHGRSIGDSLLRLVAQRLRREAISEISGRPYDAADAANPRVVDARAEESADLIVARIGGDQFAVACRLDHGSPPNLRELDARAAAFAARLITALGVPTRLAGQTLFVRASIGVAVHPNDASDPAVLFSHAEAALMRAKRSGRNQARRHGDDGTAVRTLALPPDTLAGLRAALASDQFLLVYQPKFELASSISFSESDLGSTDPGLALAPGALIGVEALVRWRTASGALYVPQQFIPLAESSGMIRPLGDWVLATALREASQFAARGGARVGVSVNVSLLQLHDRAFLHYVEEMLSEHGFAPAELTFEIAETGFLEDIRLVADTLAELSAMGVRLAIDHFGIGTGGLVALKSLPIDEIKIDRSFIAGAAIDAFDATIVAGLIAMAHNLGIQVTADGVERADQIASLCQMRCDAIQGYFVGEPMTADQLVAVPRLWRNTGKGTVKAVAGRTAARGIRGGPR